MRGALGVCGCPRVGALICCGRPGLPGVRVCVVLVVVWWVWDSDAELHVTLAAAGAGCDGWSEVMVPPVGVDRLRRATTAAKVTGLFSSSLLSSLLAPAYEADTSRFLSSCLGLLLRGGLGGLLPSITLLF
jgi:hypothetical protein